MKNLKLIACSLILMLLGTFYSVAQEEYPEMIIIRTLEFAGRAGRSGIVTIEPDGKTTKINLKNGWDESSSNVLVIQKEIEKWKLEGYVITHLSTSGEEIFRTTIILER